MANLSKYVREHCSPTKGCKFGQYHLRKIVKRIRYGENMFDRDYVLFECGHEGEATIGAIRGRCKKCIKAHA